MTAGFATGTRVRVADRIVTGHVRTPGYVRGKLGVIERMCGFFGNPEELAYGRCGGAVALYRVRFARRELWPEDASDLNDTVDVELYEHWLVAADP